ncbi:MAG: RNA polymerase sigma factor [Bacteroidaceae bacterium]|nr:RNA polymerase sigma factor [Bacteroidaceae bacterium]
MKLLGIGHGHRQTARLTEAERPRMLQYALYRLGNRADAEDAVQDAFVRMYQRMAGEGLEDRNLTGYLYRTLANVCVSRLREAGRLQTVPLDGQADAAEPETEDMEAEFRRISQLLDGIPDEQVEVIRLHYYGDKTFREIADILGVPVTTAKSRFVYGLEKIRRKLRVES